MPALKNTKHENFVQAIFKGESGTEAYRQHVATKEMTSEVAGAAAARLLASVRVAARLFELKQASADRLIVTRELLEQKVWDLAAKAEKAEQLGVAKSCYELLGRDKGAFQERKQLTVRSMTQLTEEELADELARLEAGNEGEAEAGSAGGTRAAASRKAGQGRSGRVIN